MRTQQTTIATSKRSPREQRERNTALRLAALLDACFNRPVQVLDPEFDRVDEISYELAH